MTGHLLQFIWQMQYFNRTELLTAEGDPLQIISPGEWNLNQGPDFKGARIRIGDNTWVGHIELHVLASDWNLHKHASDRNYSNIILHVVWENDVSITNSSGNPIPALVLQDKVSKLLLQRYEELMQAPNPIACAGNIHKVKSLVWASWKQRMITERLERKARHISEHLKHCRNHWEEVFWWTIARNFGIHLNAESFEAIAMSLPIRILTKHKSQVQQLEAFLFGQAGLLDREFKDKYPAMLKKEYEFLRTKYRITPIKVPIHFLRMRPGNFPSIRLAQLAMLIHQSTHLFSQIREADSIKQVMKLLDITANDYWHYRYVWDEASSFRKKTLGRQMVDNIIINTVVPSLFAYGLMHNEAHHKEKALHWLDRVATERNSILAEWDRIGVISRSASDSQALLELRHSYCNGKYCLNCAIGNALLKRTIGGGN